MLSNIKEFVLKQNIEVGFIVPELISWSSDSELLLQSTKSNSQKHSSVALALMIIYVILLSVMRR